MIDSKFCFVSYNNGHHDCRKMSSSILISQNLTPCKASSIYCKQPNPIKSYLLLHTVTPILAIGNQIKMSSKYSSQSVITCNNLKEKQKYESVKRMNQVYKQYLISRRSSLTLLILVSSN